MNLHDRDISAEMNRDDAADMLERLRGWAARASEEDLAQLDPQLRALLPGPVPSYPLFSTAYPQGFTVDAAYRAGLPDLQNGTLVRGARRHIQHVGISNFRLPLRVALRDGGEASVQASVTGSVSLAAEMKGINMSRIMRTFYRNAEDSFDLDVIERTLDAYKTDLGSFDARIMMRLSMPLRVDSLRSGLSGWQYYDLAFEVVDLDGTRKRIMHLDYVYSSTCPCSLELAEHARRTRGQLATPHSQRSVARISVELTGGELFVEDLIDHCRAAIPTETQVMVKREDEQAFAELNAANPIFVEDAVRLLAQALASDPAIGDFRVLASHQESLHSHDAVSLLTEGETFAQTSLEPGLFASLHHGG
ncbi:GTP cyclohydrolase I FolE2 [Palleronia sediminis]|uniref:GTP cyclohydrolase FolE2 n=1 Tax=Palleronia sediminis TaxID=2547833 RepID=A0A4R6A9Z6_9RHOB|nr:GTP cyclohydrolase FolE2 [Palleronia sediminis]TDL79827.1 GTP cyclohydrolase I FolE2 [Palleronia sediminis]